MRILLFQIRRRTMQIFNYLFKLIYVKFHLISMIIPLVTRLISICVCVIWGTELVSRENTPLAVFFRIKELRHESSLLGERENNIKGNSFN